MAKKAKRNPDPKATDLANNTEVGTETTLTTNQGVPVSDNQNSLKAGPRGPTLLEDFILREKITHFDHERIPERVVHARGSGAHGVFKVYESQAELTRAAFLQDPAVETPVFVRFSTVAGSRGSSDLARDVRGFAVKFYTSEGNYDLVGNNIPVFFIQDAIKFPDLVHAVKPEPHNEIPQAASAHDTFWDFISLMPESMHMIMWVMSDRGIPRSLRMMEGFGVHTFRFVNLQGKSRFVKFHWKPLLGVHSVAWDEALRISGADPDFHRRDLWEAIENGDFPEWELGVQIVEEGEEGKFDFDLLDATKLIPEELVPVKPIGKLTLNRNPDNFFAETEQVAFHTGHVVPGIDFTNDPLLQGRLFSYLDTQLIRLGGPNFHEIPINRPIAALHNNQRDGHMRQTINKGRVSYEPNTLGGNSPKQAPFAKGGFASYEEKMQGVKASVRSESFFDHFTQAAMFFKSQSETEQTHIINALRFELSKLTVPAIQERMLYMLAQVDPTIASRVATGLGMDVPAKIDGPLNMSVPADGDPEHFQPKKVNANVAASPALSMANTVKDTVATRRVAALASDGCDGAAIQAMKKLLTDAGAQMVVVAPHLGTLKAADGSQVAVDASLLSTPSVVFDAVFVPGGRASIEDLSNDLDAIRFVSEACRHCKPIAATGEGLEFLQQTDVSHLLMDGDGTAQDPGILVSREGVNAIGKKFLDAIAKHRNWDREKALGLPQ